MSSNYPYVSVIIPNLNGESAIRSCVASLSVQDYPKDRYEIIVIDNGSKDKSVEILQKMRIQHDVETRPGRAAALNRGVRRSLGDIIATTDIDCLAEPQWLSSIVKSFKNPSVACVAGDIKLLKKSDRSIEAFQARQNYMSPMHARNRKSRTYLPFADGANAAFRRNLFDEIGYFDEKFIKGADVEICYRMLRNTNYELVFDEKAIVWEPGESSLPKLLKQRFRIGIGQMFLRNKYRDLFWKRSTLKHRYWAMRNLFLSFHHCLNLYVRSVHYHEQKDKAYDEMVKMMMRFAEYLGQKCSPLYLRDYQDQDKAR